MSYSNAPIKGDAKHWRKVFEANHPDKLWKRIAQLEADKRVLVEALEEISNDWVEVNRVGMSHIAAKALAQVKGDE